MIKRMLWMLVALATAAQAAPPDSGVPPFRELNPLPQQSRAAHLAAEVLSRYHYKSSPLDDALSERIFEQYLKSLDPEKLFFVQGDIDRWAGERSRLDDAIRAGELAVPFAMFNLYARRVSERFAHARSLLKLGFDFSQTETYQYAREKEPWARSEAEMSELWRKRVKNDWLRLKLAGKDDGQIAETLDRRYANALKRTARLKSEDAFQAFMNAYAMTIEPHTSYMGPRAAGDFDISMRLSLVGIGAVLAEKDDYTTIRELVPGGPAILSGQLKVGDRILGVAQGESGAMMDIVGWRLDDVVEQIRGTADSVVRLDILPGDAGPDGKHSVVSLVRKKITLEEQAAKKSIHSVLDGEVTRRIGVIALPTFYQDFDARQRGVPDFKSATRDVARLLKELKAEKVDSVLIDLRNNGGGSLMEAVELTGLFIDKGPVVQQRDARGNIAVESDVRAGVAWDGPLGVLINRGSASASEIFAAAIQDYGRGLVMGEPSFGKGTVQTMIDLDQLSKDGSRKLGELKLTIAQFFRINGGTTQLHGVKPDIAFPALSDAESFGESSFDNALPGGRIRPAAYVPIADLTQVRSILLARHEARMKESKEFQFLQEDIAEIDVQRRKGLVSLNEAERRAERDAVEARLKARETATKPGKGSPEGAAGSEMAAKRSALQDDGLQADERNLASELAAEAVRKNDKDVLLNEAARILGDAVGLRGATPKLAARAKVASPQTEGRVR